jgi:hypothetical protein
MKRSILTEMLSQSEHIRGLIQQSAAAVISASAGMQHQFVNSEPLPGVSQVLDHHAAATRQLHGAVERLTVLKQVLQGEIRERALLDHQLAAAFEQEEGSRKAALHDQLTGLSNRVLFKMLAAIQASCEVFGPDGRVNLWVGGSIGISVFPKDGARGPRQRCG